MRISLDTIAPDASTQARHGTDAAVIADYAEAMREGATFPPVVLFRDPDGTTRVGDGFHRIAAARLAGMTVIEAETRDGGAREALGHSILSNARHELRFSNRDKRRVVGIMLDDLEWSKLSDREIARRCGVSQPFVGKLRPDRGDNGYQPSGPLSPEEQVPMIGDLPVGHLDPGCEYLSGEGKRRTYAKVFPSTTPGYWFVTAFGLAAKIVEGMTRPIREDALPTAIHVCGFVCDVDTRWEASLCFPVSWNDDLAGDVRVGRA